MKIQFMYRLLPVTFLLLLAGSSHSQVIKAGRFPYAGMRLTATVPQLTQTRPDMHENEYEAADDPGVTVRDGNYKFRRKVTFQRTPPAQMQETEKPTVAVNALARSQWDVPMDGVDPMIAVGHDFIIACDGGELAYYDKGGRPLLGAAVLPANVSQLFSIFLQREINGQPNPNHPSNWFPNVPEDVPMDCNIKNPNETDDGIIQEAYDTRVIYEKTYKRFIILSAIRNHCWSCRGFCTDDLKNTCRNAMIRLYAWAVSVSQDPRDGFYTYITGDNNPRDWPRVTVDQDYMVVAHNGKGRMGTAAISIYSWPDMAAGLPNIRRVDFKADQISPRMYIPVQNRLSASGEMLFIHRVDDGNIDFYHIKKPGIRSDIFKNAALIRPSYIGGMNSENNAFKGPFAGATWDNKGLHFTTTKLEEGSEGPAFAPRYGAIIWNIPFSNVGGKLQIKPLNAANGYRCYQIRSDYSYEMPAMAVGSLGDVFLAFVRSSVQADGRPPEIRYTTWIHGKDEPISSVLVRKSESQPTYKCESCYTEIPDNLINEDHDIIHLDYAWAAEDPAETGVFWLSHVYFNSDKKRRMHIAKVNVVGLY